MLKIANYQTPNATAVAPPERAAQTPQSIQESIQAPKGSFAKELQSAAVKRPSAVQFSKHALQRMHSRGVELSPPQLTRLSEAMDNAQRKGARETLVLTDDAAFVVSPANRTVISAFDRETLREGVFTQIDSAIIL